LFGHRATSTDDEDCNELRLFDGKPDMADGAKDIDGLESRMPRDERGASTKHCMRLASHGTFRGRLRGLAATFMKSLG
jgi:hypothetical protein